MTGPFRPAVNCAVLNLSFVVGIALAVPWGDGLRAAPDVTAIQFSIRDAPGDTVFSDGKVAADPFQYSDYRFAGQADSCVDAQETSRSFVFIVLNRRIGDSGPRCNPNPYDDPLPQGRQVRLTIDTEHACGELEAYDARYVDRTPTSDPRVVCTLTGADNLRIRLSNVHAPKLPATTPVDFLISSFEAPAGHGGFEIRSNSGAAISGDATTRTITYDGTASLWKYSTSVRKGPAITGGPVSVRLGMTLLKAKF